MWAPTTAVQGCLVICSLLLLSASGQSLFDEVDLTLGAADTSLTTSHSPQGSSLFGGPKMSFSMTELQREGVEKDPSSVNVPVSGFYNVKQPLKSRVASATVSTGGTSLRRGGSLFDDLPNAGAAFHNHGASHTGNTRLISRKKSRIPDQHSSLFDASDFILPSEVVDEDYPAYSDSPEVDVEPHRPPQLGTHRFQLPFNRNNSLQEPDPAITSQALQLLVRYAQHLATALNTSTTPPDTTSNTFPHPVQGDFQLATETLATTENPKNMTFREDELVDFYSLFHDDDNLPKLSKVLDPSVDGSKEVSSEKDLDEEEIAEIRRRRLEDLKLAMEIITAFETPLLKEDKTSEEFELKLAKSIFNQQINSLSELNRKQRDTLQSLMIMVKSPRFRQPNSYIVPPARDPRPDAPALTTNYQPPSQDRAPANYLIAAQPRDPPAPPPVVVPPSNYLTPSQYTAPAEQRQPPAPPVREPTNSYLLPDRNQRPAQSAPARDPEPPSVSITPAEIYLLTNRGSTAERRVDQRQQAAPTTNLVTAYRPPSRDPAPAPPRPPSVLYVALPPTPPSPANPQPSPPAPPTITPPTTQKPSAGYLPPTAEQAEPVNSYYRPPSGFLPLESTGSRDEADQWKPITPPSNPVSSSSYPLNTPADERPSASHNESKGSVYYYHYHYHFAGDGDQSSDKADKGSSDTREDDGYGSGRCKPGRNCDDQTQADSVESSPEASYDSYHQKSRNHISRSPSKRRPSSSFSSRELRDPSLTLDPPSNAITAQQDQSNPLISSYSSLSQEDPADSRATPSPALNAHRKGLKYGPPPTPSNPPRPGYGPPPTPSNPPRPGYGPPPTPSNPPRPGYGPPPTPSNPPRPTYGPPPTPSNPPRPRYGPPPTPPPADPPSPMYGYGPPPTPPPADPPSPMYGYGPPPTPPPADPPSPMYGYGPPPTPPPADPPSPMYGYGPPPTPPPADPPSPMYGYGPPPTPPPADPPSPMYGYGPPPTPPPADPPSPMYGYGPPPTPPPADPPSPMYGYGPPPTPPPADPPSPMYGYGPPPTPPPADPPSPMYGYGPPPTPPPADPPSPMYGYGPPPTPPPADPPSPMYGYGPPPPSNPPRPTYGYRPPPTRPSNPPTPMNGYGAPAPNTPAPPTPGPPAPPLAPPTALGPPRNTNRYPRSPLPGSYGLPRTTSSLAQPTTTPSTVYGAPPQLDPQPPAPPPTARTKHKVIMVQARPPPPPRDPFSLKKKSKPPKFFQRAPVVAIGPVPIGHQVYSAQSPSSTQKDPVQQQRDALEMQRDELQLQYLRNQQQLQQQEQELRDLNQLQLQIQVQEMQRKQLKKDLFLELKKDESFDFKKLFYDGAMLLGAMSLLPIAAGRRKREILQHPLPDISSTLLSIPITLPEALNNTTLEMIPHPPHANASISSDNDINVRRMTEQSDIQDQTLLQSSLPAAVVLRDYGCLHQSFCKLMAQLEGTPYHRDFLDQYLQMFPEESRGPWVDQALQDALHREQQATAPGEKENCDVFHCGAPEQYL